MTNKRMYALEIDGKLGRLLYPLARAEETAKHMVEAGIACEVVLMSKSDKEDLTIFKPYVGQNNYDRSPLKDAFTVGSVEIGASGADKTEAEKFREAIGPRVVKGYSVVFAEDLAAFKEAMEAAKVKGVNHIPFVAHNELIVDEVKRMGFIVYRGNSDTISTRYFATVDMRYDQ